MSKCILDYRWSRLFQKLGNFSIPNATSDKRGLPAHCMVSIIV